MLRKIYWVLCSLYNVCLFKKFGFPSYIYSPMVVQGKNKISVGKKVRIYPQARIEAFGKRANIRFGDDISVGPNVNITSMGNITVGDGTTISSGVFITDVDHEYTFIDLPIMKQPNLIRDVEIGKNCFIGTGAVILPGTRLGKQCIVGANSVVRGYFDDYCVVVGSPAKIVKKYDSDLNEWVKV
ncbi:acyltransferase [Vibrio sp. OPT10]|uniref:acyltransferase n=1 Tax=Vibrio sp. OPT10 TaxID=2778640 RepID=UPI0018829E67|nr:acyltransferase [Vibrio sp. OPT10]MBE8607847.1 acyltransferase [Vibrio sp. OPT10]